MSEKTSPRKYLMKSVWSNMFNVLCVFLFILISGYPRPSLSKTPLNPEHVKDPTTLNVREIEASQLQEWQKGDRRYIGMSGDHYERAKQKGAKTVMIPEYSTYFMYWLPEDWEMLLKKRIIILMHGHDGTAAPRLADLYDNARHYQFGMVSVQWGWRPGKGQEYRYLDETVDGMKVCYHIMELALEYIELHHGVDKHLSAWNGF